MLLAARNKFRSDTGVRQKLEEEYNQEGEIIIAELYGESVIHNAAQVEYGWLKDEEVYVDQGVDPVEEETFGSELKKPKQTVGPKKEKSNKRKQ